jgi:hypothetical protein
VCCRWAGTVGLPQHLVREAACLVDLFAYPSGVALDLPLVVEVALAKHGEDEPRVMAEMSVLVHRQRRGPGGWAIGRRAPSADIRGDQDC